MTKWRNQFAISNQSTYSLRVHKPFLYSRLLGKVHLVMHVLYISFYDALGKGCIPDLRLAVGGVLYCWMFAEGCHAVENSSCRE